MTNIFKSILSFLIGGIVLILMIIPSDSPFDYPESKWESSDGKMIITVDGLNNGKRTNKGTLTYNNDNISIVYDLYEGHAQSVRIYKENEYSRENIDDYLGSFSVFLGGENIFFADFISKNDDCPPTLGTSPWFWEEYVFFKRVDE